MYDLDNLLLYLQEIAKVADTLKRKGAIHICRRYEMTQEEIDQHKADLERACGFKVSITKAHNPPPHPKTHPYVHRVKRLDEEHKMERDHEDLLLLLPTNSGQGRAASHHSQALLPQGAMPQEE